MTGWVSVSEAEAAAGAQATATLLGLTPVTGR
jgi:hypothetical protein